MRRTATAFMLLAAVGGCVTTNDAGPAAALTAQPGQPAPGGLPAYASWNRPNQVLIPKDVAEVSSRATAAPPPAPAAAPQTPIVQKPRAPFLPAPTPPPAMLTVAPAAPVVDSELVAATLVQTPGGAEAPAHEAAPVRETAVAQEALVIREARLVQEAPPAPKAADANIDGEASARALPADARLVNSKRITLNYEVKDVGASGVAGVELWCTRDTHAWQRGEIIAQTSHSFTVEVKDEGVYGFTLLARNGSGAGLEPPKPGDQPQAWVSVSVLKPAVAITALESTHNGQGPGLMIRWAAKDKDLGPRPINLAYAEELSGPWTPIAAGLENSGQYEWLPTGALPHHLYVRVEARNLHGNVGAAQTANALRIDAEALAAVAPPPVPPESPVVRRPLPALPAPPPLDASRPTVAIVGVEAAAD